jgi:hypothetical protein
MLDRRAFLGIGGAATLGLRHGPAFAAATDGSAPRIQRYVPLGQTGLKISDISFGSASSADPALIRHALDRGITYFDTAESYRFGASEEALGTGLMGVRDKVVLASKTKARANDRQEEMMQSLEGSLRRLRTDYLDIYFNHAVNSPSRMQNEEWWAFTDKAKAQGKIRFRGMSGHGSGLVESLDYALDNSLVDVILTAFNFGQDPSFFERMKTSLHYVDFQQDLPPRLTRAREKGVGVIAMKTLMGARLNDLRPFERGGTFAQAAFRWVLASNLADGLIVSMNNPDQVDEYVEASGDPQLTDRDHDLLVHYSALNSQNYCRPACNQCAGSCPNDVPIAEVLRTRMYDVDYRDRDMALADYGRLSLGARACLGCDGEPCRDACPYGLVISDLTRDAAHRLG